ncbi:radical SAM family RiPP maturation amino acid epimerase [Scytonema hofmannii PCC 7110]|uniref:Radical SAM family RiPP maturation amino acid epimerase n=1 Tax=Scytonema hofmannii PCC 7110 TaxID=128403 RepID=A0A139XEN6_9CYAN|nr:radical SAM family RiPP maturation amino acid epimerase [Scytonema hofmannii]KYC43082.1 radical SAM family RiPP maturation amino acid epimerase [Scytonema hofmannii PCC 7110]
MQTQEISQQVEVQLIPPPFNIKEYCIDNYDSFETIDRIDPKLLSKFSQVKRFIERWEADQEFRKQVLKDPYATFVRYGLKLNPEDVRPKWDKDCASKWKQETSSFLLLKLSNEFYERLDKATNEPESAPSDPHIRVWRERQIARTASQFNPAFHKVIQHIPVCFELSKGCSIGCRFCAVSAPRLTDIFFYTVENAKLWREVLEVMKSFLGDAAGNGFCYWATDPLDNPDYEKFCIDFHAVTGYLPQTTTAQPMKNPEMTRSLLKLSKEKNGICNRFSIPSLKMLEQVHQEFSPEELLGVQIEFLNDGAEGAEKAHAGRQRERNLQQGKIDEESHKQGTIACVSGFLFNMVERSVKLISPCNADKRWPLGYIVYDLGTFVNADDLKTLIERMIQDNMSQMVRLGDLIRFRRDLTYEALVDGFQVSTRIKTFKFRHDPFWKELGAIIHQGNHTTVEITQLFASKGVSSAHISYYLNVLFKHGVLDSEPQL